MDQRVLNKQEWERDENWTSGTRLLAVYFSHKDSRTWVPKRIPGSGWTLNLAKRAGVFWLIGFMVGIPFLMAVTAAVIFAVAK
ncbi:MAG: DUF5808 domain-containing protein [Planctomycetota bacterium]|jgi:uncharacterized membrane protein